MALSIWAFLAFALLAALGVVAVICRGQRRAQLAAAHAEQARHALRRSRATAVVAHRLRASDPDFDPDRFVARVSRAFLAVQQAASEGDLCPARPWVSDGVYERLVLEREDRQRRGAARPRCEWAVDAVSLAHVEAGAVFDQLTVGIKARAGVELVGTFWTFLRRHGAHTRSEPSLLERRCPNCSAPIEVLDSANCTSCHALLRSGEHDWVLAEITQPDAWRPRSTARIPGVTRLLAADPGFSPQHLEDRVGVLFWRMLLAEREDRGAERLTAMATPEWCARFDAAHAALERPDRHTLARDVELGSIDIVGALEEDGWHRVAATAAWSGWHRDIRDRRLRGVRLFVLARQVGATTRLEHAISSAHCARCGAPERGGASASCTWCGTRLNDGSGDWILEDSDDTRSPRAREIIRTFAAAPLSASWEPDLAALCAGAFPWVAKLLTASGRPDESARRELVTLAARLDVDATNRAVDADPDPAKDEAFGPTQMRRALPALVDLGLAHDALGEEGRRVLAELAARAGLIDLDLRSLIDRRTREWDGRAEAARQEAAARERDRERAEWVESVAAQAHRED